MIRLLVYLAAGVLLGGIIHIIVILTLPSLAGETVWGRLAALEARDRIVAITADETGAMPFGLDPAPVYGLCEVDLAEAPAYMRGTLPVGFWSLGVFDSDGVLVYSTTNRDGIGQRVDIGIFNPSQTRQLARQQLDIDEGLLIVESMRNRLFLLVRLVPSHPEMRARYQEALTALSCGND